MDYYKILIVDDEEEVRTSIIRKIPWEELGYQVAGDAENGEDALEKARILEPDLILTDIKMPYMDGLTLAERIKEERSSTQIVLFSGFDEFEYAKQAIRLHVMEYILKPVNVEELTEILRKLKVKMDENIAEKRDVEALRRDYQAMLPVVKEHFLADLVHGKLDTDAIWDGFARFGLCDRETAAGWKWLAASVLIEMPKADGGIQELSLHAEKELIPFSVQKLLEEKLTDRIAHLDFMSTYGPCLICAMKNEREFTTLIGLFDQVCRDCRKILELNVTIGVGEPYGQPEALCESCQESKDALGYRATIGSGTVIYINDVEAVHDTYLEFDAQSEGALIGAIKFGGRSDIVREVEKLIAKMEQAKVHTSQHQIYLISIINCLMQLIQKYELDIYTVWGKDTDYLDVISHLITAESMQNFLINTCVAISENIHVERDNSVKNTIREAESYIMDHYANPDLSVEMICEHLHISPAYFSTIFKREVGRNYVNYITEIRLDKAVELLNKTDDKTYVIAAKVGYQEPNYFSYVFKKQFGMSPSKYRSSRQ